MKPDKTISTEESKIFMDKEGRWFHEGVEISHSRTSLLFSKMLNKGPNGKYYITVKNESVMVELEDAPFVVKSVTVIKNKEGFVQDFILHLNDKSQEPLVPDTLMLGEENVMYCKVKKASERARFLRPAYYQLCSQIEAGETKGQYFLPWQGKKIRINVST